MSDPSPETHHSNQINKIFLLVFHGGMVGYLLTHNLIVPLVRNFGLNVFLLKGIDYYWVLQVLLFILFAHYNFDKKEKGWVPFLIYTTLYSTLLGMLFFYFSISGKKVELFHFGPSISLASLLIFLMGFFGYFKRFFNWETDRPFARQLFSLILGLAISYSYLKLENPYEPKQVTTQVKKGKEGPDLKSLGCNGSDIRFSVPLQMEVYSKAARLEECGFSENLNRLNNRDNLVIVNSTHRSHHFRLEHYRNGHWEFRKIHVLKSGGMIPLPRQFTGEDGFYRLKIPTNAKFGIQLILKGKLTPGKYHITPKKFEVEKNE